MILAWTTWSIIDKTSFLPAQPWKKSKNCSGLCWLIFSSACSDTVFVGYAEFNPVFLGLQAGSSSIVPCLPDHSRCLGGNIGFVSSSIRLLSTASNIAAIRFTAHFSHPTRFFAPYGPYSFFLQPNLAKPEPKRYKSVPRCKLM